MSEFRCQVPGCSGLDHEGNHIYESDTEAVAKHKSIHDDRTVIAREKNIERVLARNLSVKHIGRKVEVLGELMELRKVSFVDHQVELDLGRFRMDKAFPASESLFWDVSGGAVLRMQKLNLEMPVVVPNEKNKCGSRTKLGKRFGQKLGRFFWKSKFLLSGAAEVAGPPLVATVVVVVLFIPLFLWGQADPTVPQSLGVPAALVLAAVWWAVFLPLSDWLS